MLKKNNKGYILLETIIVLTIVALSITTIYANSVNLYINQKNELTKFNTVGGLYSASAVKKNLNIYEDELKNNMQNGYINVSKYLKYNKLSNNVEFLDELDIKDLYLSTYNMTNLLSTDELVSSIKNNLNNIKNDNKCLYRYIAIFNDYSYSLIGLDCNK